MTKNCLSAAELINRGLEEAYGQNLSNGSCTEGLDAEDQVILLDEIGGIVYQSPVDSFQKFTTLFDYHPENEDRPVIQTINGKDLYMAGNGQVLGFPHDALVSTSPQSSVYKTVSRDGKLIFINTVSNTGYNEWDIELKVEKGNGILVRRKKMTLQKRKNTPSLKETKTSWFSNNGREFLRATDWWRSRTFPQMGPVSNVLSVEIYNPYFGHTIWGPANNEPESTFAWSTPVSRHTLYRNIDNFLVRHSVTIDPHEKRAKIDNHQFTVEAANPYTDISEDESTVRLSNVIFLAPLMVLLPSEETQILTGESAELEEKAAAVIQPKSACADQIKRVFTDANVQGSVCLQGKKAIVFVRSLSNYAVKTDLRKELQEVVPHEIGHLFHSGKPSLMNRFHSVFVRYTAFALLKADIASGPDFDLLFHVASDPAIDISDLSEKEQDRMQWVWEKYDLWRFFPSLHSLNNGDEFFASLVQKYRPWYRYQENPPAYFGFFEALDLLAEEGETAFFQVISERYPDLQKIRFAGDKKKD